MRLLFISFFLGLRPPFSVQIPNVKQIPQHRQGTLSQNILLMLQLHPCNPPPWLHKVPNQSMQTVTKHILTLHGFGQVHSWSEFGLNISHRVTVPLLILYRCQTRKKVHMGRAYLLETHINTHKHVQTRKNIKYMALGQIFRGECCQLEYEAHHVGLL